ncbi:hypothetical protein MHYP_G00344190 [Metynnis hypsauchen]
MTSQADKFKPTNQSQGNEVGRSSKAVINIFGCREGRGKKAHSEPSQSRKGKESSSSLWSGKGRGRKALIFLEMTKPPPGYNLS